MIFRLQKFPPEYIGCQQTRTAGEPLECPVVTAGNAFEVLLSQGSRGVVGAVPGSLGYRGVTLVARGGL